MKLLFDFLPVVLFFITYKAYDIYTATLVIMVALSIQTTIFWIKHKKIDFNHTITLVLVMILGVATLIFKNEIFIKWKPTAINWTFAVLLLGSQFIGTKTIIQRLMGNKITLPEIVWTRLNMSWAIFFIVSGIANIYVAYNFSTATWVNFKVFGVLGGTLAFGIAQSLYLAKHLKEAPQ